MMKIIKNIVSTVISIFKKKDEEIASQEMLEAIYFILEKIPSAIFGGSIALHSVGLLERKISDIDLIFSQNEDFRFEDIFTTSKDFPVASEHLEDGDFNLMNITVTGVYTKNIKTCLFRVPDEMLQYSEMDFFGRKIKVQNVNHAILIKNKYSQKNIKKHIDDLKVIKKKLKKSFSNNDDLQF